jgi:uncharacterized protein (DUF1810 family)
MNESNLDRFIEAQEKVYSTVVSELNSGYKRTHWIWYIFPQIQGLGRSETARYYAIKNKEEALAYLDHPVLGKRLIECAAIVANQQVVFPYPDDMKLKSSMTLFGNISDNHIFDDVLTKYYDGKKDKQTIKLLNLN